MEAYRIDRFGSVDGIVLRSSEDPRPGLREILMRVRASSLNYRDLMVLKGGGRGPKGSASCRSPTAPARLLQSGTA
jgi:NADPH:quinone reductase-like Zn-dependent oxidoreductase